MQAQQVTVVVTVQSAYSKDGLVTQRPAKTEQAILPIATHTAASSHSK